MINVDAYEVKDGEWEGLYNILVRGIVTKEQVEEVQKFMDTL